MSRLLNEALRYAEMGWHVFPCGVRSKLPLIRREEGGRGYLDATTDPEQIRGWWGRQPGANIGLACEMSGLVVLDVDGEEGFASQVAHPGPIPLTTVHRTGNGYHLLYRIPEGATARRSCTSVDGWAKLDVRSNGYILLPPSVHPSGFTYYAQYPVTRVEPQPAPDWLLEPERPDPRPVRPAEVELGDADGTTYGAAALRALLPDLAAATRGTRNDSLFRVAIRCAELVAAGHLSEMDARRRLRMAADVAWSGDNAEREITRTIDGAFQRGGVS